MNLVIHSTVELMQGGHDNAPAVLVMVDQIDAEESISYDFMLTVELQCKYCKVPIKDMDGKLCRAG